MSFKVAVAYCASASAADGELVKDSRPQKVSTHIKEHSDRFPTVCPAAS